jgi:hypothetical protein
MEESRIPLEWVPSLPRRYATTVIDAFLVLFVIIALSSLLPGGDRSSTAMRLALAAAFLLVYEPLATGRFTTLGQRVTGVRVRSFSTGERIGILRAYVRLFVKAFLGFISFLALPFSNGRRALHDQAADSIVILASHEDDFRQWAERSGLRP